MTVGMGRVQEMQRGFEAIFALSWAALSIRNEAQYLPKEVQVDKNLILVIQGHLWTEMEGQLWSFQILFLCPVSKFHWFFHQAGVVLLLLLLCMNDWLLSPAFISNCELFYKTRKNEPDSILIVFSFQIMAVVTTPPQIGQMSVAQGMPCSVVIDTGLPCNSKTHLISVKISLHERCWQLWKSWHNPFLWQSMGLLS